MMQKTIQLLVGVPGSGKTTYAAKLEKVANSYGYSYKHISRDVIRFALLEENDGYFDREDDVFENFIRTIQESIDTGIDIIVVDATHISRGSRLKLFASLELKGYDIEAVAFKVPLEVCLERNAQRSGRAVVPDSVIKNMHASMTIPTVAELDIYNPGGDNRVVVEGSVLSI